MATPTPTLAPLLTDTLCTRCGLCCDGTLFGDVELSGPLEATRLEVLGLNLDEDDAGAELLSLPCSALRGTHCSVYAHRPRCCRTFECRLLQGARRGMVTVAQALAKIADARAQVDQVEALLARVEVRPVRLPLAERCADAIADLSEGSPLQTRSRDALDAAMSAVAHTVRTTFLG